MCVGARAGARIFKPPWDGGVLGRLPPSVERTTRTIAAVEAFGPRTCRRVSSATPGEFRYDRWRHALAFGCTRVRSLRVRVVAIRALETHRNRTARTRGGRMDVCARARSA